MARVAQASAVVRLGPVAFAAVAANSVAKGDVLTVATLAGIMAAKQTANLIPLCHSLSLSKVRHACAGPARPGLAAASLCCDALCSPCSSS